MSADMGYTLNRSQLLKKARDVQACDTFTQERGGRRGWCSVCDASEAEHMVVALQRKAPVSADPGGGVKRP